VVGLEQEDSYWGKVEEQRSLGSDPYLVLQYYPCQILTLQGWFMSPVSYTLYIYTDGIFPFLDGGVISTPVPFFEPPSSSMSFSLPLRYFNGNLSKFTSW